LLSPSHKCYNCTVSSTHVNLTHVNFWQQTDGERLRDVSWQAVLVMAVPDRRFG
jgi:hypothetical protein